MAASNRNAFDDFFDDDEPESVVDTKADGRLLRVPLSRMVPNGVNPRTDFGTAEQLEDLGRSLKRRQIQAVPVVTKRAYLKLWPDHEGRIGNVDVVIVSGERRWRAATAVDLGALDCVINDDVAVSRKSFIEAVVSENVDRANFDPVEEAYAVVALVTEFGTNRAVAQHFERADGWVTQRVLLTHLAPSVQALVRQKLMPVEKARTLGKLARDHSWTEEQQAAWWGEQQAERKAAAATRRSEKSRKAPKVRESGPGFTTSGDSDRRREGQSGGEKSADEIRSDSSKAVATGFPAQTTSSSAESRPAPAPEGEEGPVVRWADSEHVFQQIIASMSPADRRQLTVRLLRYNSAESEAADASDAGMSA
ncbi:ParB/RepB/Spo0J family partition protein [Streptomyces tsukubensis]|uniref:ParB/RepB/Spo0J family partition protein n=1 Tax=Streptomyces tsukubensis TaxID=83656 RepID=UPI0036A0CF15